MKYEVLVVATLTHLPPNISRYLTQTPCEKQGWLQPHRQTWDSPRTHSGQSQSCFFYAIAPPPSVGWFLTHLGRCSRETLRHWISAQHWLVFWAWESEFWNQSGGRERERGGKMMATLSLTGTVTSWQQTVGMRRRTVGVLCFALLGVKRRIMQNI